MKVSTQKQALALSLAKLVIANTEKGNVTKESVLEIYNYMYNNLNIPDDYVTIVDDIPKQ